MGKRTQERHNVPQYLATERERCEGLRPTEGRQFLPPGWRQVPVLDFLCSHFVLTLALRQGAQFHVRRDIHTLLALSGSHLVWPHTVLQRLRRFLALRCADNSLWLNHEKLSTAAFMAHYGQWRGPYEEGTLFFYLDDYAKDHACDVLLVIRSTAHWLAQVLRRQRTLVEKNIDALAQLLHLNKAERALLLFGTLARYQRELRSMLVEFKVNNAPEAYATIADIAGVQPQDVADALRAGCRLERMGLVDNLISEHNITDLADLMKVSEKVPPVLMRQYRNERELMAVFTRPAARTALTPEHFSFVADDVGLLSQLLREAVARQTPGVNVLIYGPPGTGKTELARLLAQQAGLELFEVEYADRDGHALSGRDRYRSLQIAQLFLKGTARSALLFDEVEDVFPPLSTEVAQFMARAERLPPATGSVSGKAWVNQILESNPVPTLWVTNRIEQIDPAFRRRFAYHLELKSPPPGAREQLVRRALRGVAVSAELVVRLTQRHGLTPAQIETAVRFAELAQPEPAAKGRRKAALLDALIERQLAHADVALGQRADTLARDCPTQYDLAMLHTESRYPIERMVQALRARGHGTLCFYGPPGTGKTALAEHMAHALGRPLMLKRASDLMSKFVGETEQQMATMFAQAQAEQAVLLLDEVDSFLQDRRGAQRNYEVTEVNEMLQGMERFAGVFICTTNLLDRIDQAALRRFTFKIAFHPLRPQQRERMFVVEALAGRAEALTPVLRERLLRLDQLCPGDFAAVQRQARILGDTLSPEAFLEQLEAEHRIKPKVRESRSVGFL